MFEYPAPGPFPDGCVAAIGNFDGVHAGHRALLAAAADHAETRHLPLVALTFEPHPRHVLFPDKPLHRLTTPAAKTAALHHAGVARVAVVPFNQQVAAWTPEQFVQRVLVDWLNAKVVAVGDNFRYGHKAAGTPATLHADGRFHVVAVPLLCDAGGVISSRRLRGEG